MADFVCGTGYSKQGRLHKEAGRTVRSSRSGLGVNYILMREHHQIQRRCPGLRGSALTEKKGETGEIPMAERLRACYTLQKNRENWRKMTWRRTRLPSTCHITYIRLFKFSFLGATMNRIMFFLALTALAGSCTAVDMPQSATELGCMNCHAVDHKIVGPAWMDVSRRFRDKRNDPSVLTQLVKNVSKGSEGNWGDIPMVGTDPAGTKHDKIVDLMKFVLSLSDRAPGTRSK